MENVKVGQKVSYERLNWEMNIETVETYIKAITVSYGLERIVLLDNGDEMNAKQLIIGKTY
tara:strand:+ start:3182 stop:3364 length:183 start_codon:yes stop_codon:yes gene_type:complete